MNFFKIKTCWSNAELVVLKLCIASAYLFIGDYFHSFFHHYVDLIFAVFVITWCWSVYLWLTKMKSTG